MREFLIKVARAIARHYAMHCLYEAKENGDCLCRFCENTTCPNHRLQKDLEVVDEDIQ